MAIGNRLKFLREEKGLHQKQVAQALSVRQPTVSDWESGKQEPNPQHRKKLADLFGVTVADLYSSKKPDINSDFFKIPVLLLEDITSIKKGSDVPREKIKQFIFTTEKGRKMIATNVKTDIMEPEFIEGDFIIIDMKENAENGDFVIVKDELLSRARFKQLKIYGEKKILHPLNPKYKDIEFDQFVHDILGVVIAKQKKYK